MLVWQCVGMPNDNFFCFPYKNYIQKIQEDRKMRLVDAVFMRIKELIGYFERSTEIDDCDDAIE